MYLATNHRAVGRFVMQSMVPARPGPARRAPAVTAIILERKPEDRYPALGATVVVSDERAIRFSARCAGVTADGDCHGIVKTSNDRAPTKGSRRPGQ
jgi:hypothetical protein